MIFVLLFFFLSGKFDNSHLIIQTCYFLTFSINIKIKNLMKISIAGKFLKYTFDSDS